MMNDPITLEEMSNRSGVELRTLRSWISEGLLSPPFRPGRGARYPASNADRALAVRALKDIHGLSLAEIGRRFMVAGEEQISACALEAGVTAAPPGSAREYLREVRARNAPSAEAAFGGALGEPGMPAAPPEDRGGDLVGVERLILRLEEVLGTFAPRRSRGTAWTRIAITRDLELSVRGYLEPHERVLFERLADQFRAILNGGIRNDRS